MMISSLSLIIFALMPIALRDAAAQAADSVVIVKGAVKLYEPQGKIQLYAETLIPQGTGSLELAFRQLCEKLKAEGLFEQARKRPLPRLPQRVVIITSKTGDVLHDVLTTAYRRYPGLPPIYLMENGMANADTVVDGRVADAARIAYMHGHLEALARAREAGVDIRGFFYWSLLDNYEWDSGYDKRFGLVHVDYATQQRTLKDSALWYRDTIASAKREAGHG